MILMFTRNLPWVWFPFPFPIHVDMLDPVSTSPKEHATESDRIFFKWYISEAHYQQRNIQGGDPQSTVCIESHDFGR